MKPETKEKIVRFNRKGMIDITQLSKFHWMRIFGCAMFTWFMIGQLLVRVVAVETIRFMLNTYNIAKAFEETNKSSDFVLSHFGDSYLYVMAFYWVITIFVVMVVWKWFGLPKKIIKKKNLGVLE